MEKIYYPPEVLRLIELGKQKKLWAIEIWYNKPDEGKQVMWKRNFTSNEAMTWRAKMFRYGIQYPKGPGHWGVICPMDILTVDLYRQNEYVPENYTAVPKPEPDQGI